MSAAHPETGTFWGAMSCGRLPWHAKPPPKPKRLLAIGTCLHLKGPVASQCITTFGTNSKLGWRVWGDNPQAEFLNCTTDIGKRNVCNWSGECEQYSLACLYFVCRGKAGPSHCNPPAKTMCPTLGSRQARGGREWWLQSRGHWGMRGTGVMRWRRRGGVGLGQGLTQAGIVGLLVLPCVALVPKSWLSGFQGRANYDSPHGPHRSAGDQTRG